MPLSRGQILNNRYRIVQLLGQGGFGAVYRAWDLNLKRPFALKENLDLSQESIRQFEREASFLADLHHPNLPRVIDCFLISEQGQYLVMDFIEGKTLEEIMEHSGKALPENQVIPWIKQVCDALGFLHSQKPPVIHRDIKPANIKITPGGKAVLVDFGIAKAYYGQMQTTLGARAVTEGYSPPEQYGYGITDSRSDIYSLGATLYHALTGQRPIESVQRYLGSDLVSPRNLNRSLTPTVEKSILKAMAVDVKQRYQYVGELKTALEKHPEADIIRNIIVQPNQEEAISVFNDKLKIHTADVSSGNLELPNPIRKSKKSSIMKLGFLLIAATFIVAVGLGGLWTFFSYLSGTPTLSPTSTNIVAEPPSTITPSPIPTEIPTEIPTKILPTSTSTLTITPSPFPPTPTDTSTDKLAEWDPCPGTYLSRLHVGNQAYVSFDPPWNNNVRLSPNLGAALLGDLEPGEKMVIIDGPVCSDQMIWWNIEALNRNLTGWTSEGDMENYWLVPIP